MADDIIRITFDTEDADIVKTLANVKKLEKEIEKLRKQQDLLDGAWNKGNLSRQKYIKGTQQLNDKVDELNKTIASGSTAIDKQATHLQQAKNQTNKFGMVAQNVGYQVGDFFVQVQSGTDALVAFGQQGTQLAGLLPGVAGAVVGIGLSVSTMLIKTFSDASGEAKSLGEALEELEDYSNRVADGFDLLRDSDIEQTFGSLSDTVKDLTTESLKLSEALMFKNLGQGLAQMSIASEGVMGKMFEQPLDRLLSAGAILFTDAGNQTSQEFSESKNFAQLGFNLEKSVFEGMLQGAQKFAKSGDASGAAQAMTELFIAAMPDDPFSEDSGLTTAGIELLQVLEKQVLAVARFKAAKEDAANAGEGETDIAKAMLTLQNKLLVAETKFLGVTKAEKVEQNLIAFKQRELLRLKEAGVVFDSDEYRRAEELLEAYVEQGKEQFRLSEIEKQRLTTQKKEASAAKAAADRVEAAKKQATLALNIQNAKNRALEEEQKFKTGSEEADRAAVVAAGEIKRLQLESKGVNEALIVQAVAAAEEAERLKQGIKGAKEEATALARAIRSADTALNSLGNFGTGIKKKISIVKAEIATLKLGGDYRTAGKTAGDLFTAEQLKSKAYEAAAAADALEAGSGSEIRIAAESEYSATVTDINKLIPLLTEKGKLEADQREANKKGAKTSLQKLDEEIDKMQIQHREQVASFGLSREELYFQEAKFQLIQKVGTAESKRHMAKIEAAAKEDAANRQELETLQKIKDRNDEVALSIATSFGSAITSIVDGTKSVSDAFKDMARAIIAELYQIFVVKQITGMIANVISPGAGDSYLLARGGVLNNGQVVPYADGGVVGGPTYFPMAGGRTGLMGEAGPEAIMPLKRGKDGKLGVQAEGGAGDVIIHQNFNFQANGDESVKKIIAQQAPAIANMTKKQILDDRRRGGQMKQAFG
jgi:hypothetical protein